MNQANHLPNPMIPVSLQLPSSSPGINDLGGVPATLSPVGSLTGLVTSDIHLHEVASDFTVQPGQGMVGPANLWKQKGHADLSGSLEAEGFLRRIWIAESR